VPGPDVVLYSRGGCHLCDVARQVLRALQRTIPFEMREVDIATDPDLERRFMLEIPVVEIAGEVVTSAPIDVDAIRAAVNHARIRSADGIVPPWRASGNAD
jgi:predicted thioredoxin/glutaredoxin